MFSGALKTHIRSMHSEIKEAFIQKIIDYIEGKKEKGGHFLFYTKSTSFFFTKGETILSQI